MNAVSPEAVLSALRSRAPRSIHFGELLSMLGLAKENRDSILAVLDQLETAGTIKQLPGLRFRVAKVRRQIRARTAARGSQQGRLSMSRRGFGFVSLADGGPDAFIPAERLAGAVHGDRVAVEVWPSAKGREGEVVEILERSLRWLTGIVRRKRRDIWLDPDDLRIQGPIPISGTVPREAGPGVTVLAEVVRYPQHSRETVEVRVVDVLGPEGDASVEVAKIKLAESIVEVFPAAVAAEAEALPNRVLASERKERVDLRPMPLVTIDPSDARDHDDALYAEVDSDGGFRVIIAIADVSHYVNEGSVMDEEAERRGCSIYLPDRAIPMLPPELSSKLASLVPGKDRMCMAVDIRLSANGAIRSYSFVEGLMRSRARLSYEGAAHALNLSSQAPVEREALKHLNTLQVLLDVSRLLRKKRKRRGALELEVDEARVRLDDDGILPIDVVRSKRDTGVREAYQLVEDLMLLANELVAQQMTKHRIPCPYRVHGSPDPKKLEGFAKVASALGHPIEPEELEDPKSLARSLKKIQKAPRAKVLNFLLLRSMQQASYNTQNIGHFGLALKEYAHFTSPIRRYPDLVLHRLLKAHLRQKPLDFATLKPKIKHTCSEASFLERRAMKVERSVMDLYRVLLVRERIGE
ncbi:MAG: VacB/RNase II family 3'-5' exoribonuclease, partial [Myxococcota bacterium]